MVTTTLQHCPHVSKMWTLLCTITVFILLHPNNSIGYEFGKSCNQMYWDLVTVARLQQLYGCSESLDTLLPVHGHEACWKSVCQSELNNNNGTAWITCDFEGNNPNFQWPDVVECVMDHSGLACGLGVLGIKVAGGELYHSCACQLLEERSARIRAIMFNNADCQEHIPATLCIPNMVRAIAACSFKQSAGSAFECVQRRMQSDIAVRGTSVPVCYIHSCHSIQFIFNEVDPQCVCEGRATKLAFRKREWFGFTNQHASFAVISDDESDPNYANATFRRSEPLAARDVTLKLIPGMKLIPHKTYTDFADPQTCTRFIRCFNIHENIDDGPCFNGTDGLYCPPGEHFHVNVDDPVQNGCKPEEEVTCGNVPVTRDSPGTTPYCFEDNQDFSDVKKAEDAANNVGIRGDKVSGWEVQGDPEGHAVGVRFAYGEHPNGSAIFGDWHGGVPTNQEPSSTVWKETLGTTQEIRRLNGSTLAPGTEQQRVVRLQFEVVETKIGQPKYNQVERFSYGIQQHDTLEWNMTYPTNVEPLDACPMRYGCGSKSINGLNLQVLTIHFLECKWPVGTWCKNPDDTRILCSKQTRRRNVK